MTLDKKSQVTATNSGVNVFGAINRNGIIILSLIGFFASQKLYFKALYQINFPYSIDFSVGVNYVYTYVKTGVFPFEFFATLDAHNVIFPRLITFPNVFFNSFDVANLYYLHWGLESLALFLIFLLLKRTNPKLYWLLIPISAFIYSPLQDSGGHLFGMIMWLLPPVSIIGVIYLLDKKPSLKLISSSICLAIVGTFSTIIGIITWVPGIILLIKFNSASKKWIEKKWLAIWITSAVIIGLIFYSLFPKDAATQPNFSFLFTYDGFAFLATFISSAFRVKYHFLMILIGSSSLILGSFCVYYFTIYKKNLYRFFSEIEFFELPKQLPEVETSWLAFPLTINGNAKFSRLDIVKYLEINGIQTRPVFTGNVLRQPAFKNINHNSLEEEFDIANNITRNSFLIGCNHGLTENHIKKIKNCFTEFISKY